VKTQCVLIAYFFVMLVACPTLAFAVGNERFAAEVDGAKPMLWRDYEVLNSAFVKCIADGIAGVESKTVNQAACEQVANRRIHAMGDALKQAVLINDASPEGPQFCATRAASLIAYNRIDEGGGIAVYLVQSLLGDGTGPYGNDLQSTYVGKVVFDSLVKSSPCTPSKVEASPPVNSPSGSEMPSWWQTECDHNYASPELRGLTGAGGVYVSLRQFPTTNETVEEPRRHITFWQGGFQYRGRDQDWIAPWKNVRMVSMRKIGDRNAALVMTVTTTSSEEKTIQVGAIEYGCWREIEKLMQCYAPEKIEGSPPKTYSPLRDAKGNVVPEPKYPNQYCPNK
jgi:hypothetical protein